MSYIKCILYIKYSSSRSSSRSHYPVYRARPALPTSVCSAQLPDQLKRYYCFNIYGGGFYIDVITCDTYLRTQHKFDYSNVILSLSPGIEFNNDMQLLETYLVLLAGHLAGCHRVDPPWAVQGRCPLLHQGDKQKKDKPTTHNISAQVSGT